MRLRIPSPLPDSLEAVVTQIIGAAIEVHRRLGPGLGEGQYEDAMLIELEFQGLRFDRQRVVIIEYRGKPLRPQRIDLIVEDQVVVELKAVECIVPVHLAQVRSYVRATKLRIGLLINFNAPTLTNNIKRVIV
jgi:GxxExxY protein